MTKARIRAIREKIGKPFADDRDDMLRECLAEIERFQVILRRGDDLTPEALQVPQNQPALLPPAGKPDPKKKARGTLEEFQAFAKSIGLPESDGEAMYWKLESTEWKNGRNPIKDWRAAMRQWKAAGYHPSQNKKPTNGHRPPQERDEPAQCIL